MLKAATAQELYKRAAEETSGGEDVGVCGWTSAGGLSAVGEAGGGAAGEEAGGLPRDDGGVGAGAAGAGGDGGVLDGGGSEPLDAKISGGWRAASIS